MLVLRHPGSLTRVIGGGEGATEGGETLSYLNLD